LDAHDKNVFLKLRTVLGVTPETIKRNAIYNITNYNMKKRILVFGAHPDDVEIGMGGSVKRLTQNGHEVYMCVASIPDQREERFRETIKAAELLGVKEVIWLQMDVLDIGYNRATIGRVDRIIEQVKPYAVFTHWMEDSHQDHGNLSKCVISATRKNHFHVFMYENTIPGGVTTGAFKAQYFIDISSTIKKKLESVRIHKTQIVRNGDWWIQGIKGRAMYRGYQIRSNYAEAFEIVKVNNDIQFFPLKEIEQKNITNYINDELPVNSSGLRGTTIDSSEVIKASL